ncbi:MAG: YARHG domain-containing protein, partial [Paludibacteraceae bacterium]|nr:YARHG domain-containing protein [Paludibacteraceae bacterium]
MQLDKMQLRLLRNAFYASKGYVFKDKNLTDFVIQSEKYKQNEFIKENTKIPVLG